MSRPLCTFSDGSPVRNRGLAGSSKIGWKCSAGKDLPILPRWHCFSGSAVRYWKVWWGRQERPAALPSYRRKATFWSFGRPEKSAPPRVASLLGLISSYLSRSRRNHAKFELSNFWGCPLRVRKWKIIWGFKWDSVFTRMSWWRVWEEVQRDNVRIIAAWVEPCVSWRFRTGLAPNISKRMAIPYLIPFWGYPSRRLHALWGTK